MTDERPSFTGRQTEALELLKKYYPEGVTMLDGRGPRRIRIADRRGTGLVELVETDETPTGDAYRLTDAGADAFREDADERRGQADLN